MTKGFLFGNKARKLIFDEEMEKNFYCEKNELFQRFKMDKKFPTQMTSEGREKRAESTLASAVQFFVPFFRSLQASKLHSMQEKLDKLI